MFRILATITAVCLSTFASFADGLTERLLREATREPAKLVAENPSLINDGFFADCMLKLQPASELTSLQRHRILEGCLAAACIRSRPDVAKKLFAADEGLNAKWEAEWLKANVLMNTCQFEGAKVLFLEVRRNLYRPDLCSYRLGEIEALYGDALSAARYLSEAREFEERLNPKPLNTLPSIENSQDLFESK